VAGTNAYAAKKALIDQLTTQPGLAGVTVSYGHDVADPGRDWIYGGRVAGSQEYPNLKGGAARFSRDERLQVALVIRSLVADGSGIAGAEARATALGVVVEEFVASHLDLSGVAGLLYAGVVNVDLMSDVDDDGAYAALTYQIAFRSRLS
jgi:hypothetical protein